MTAQPRATSPSLILCEYFTYCRSRGMANNTIRCRRGWLNQLARDHDLATVTTQDLIGWLARDDWKPETRNSARSALRSFFGWAHEFEHRADNPSTRLRSVRVPTPLPRPCPTDVLDVALHAASDRDRLMLGLAAFAGLRCCEIASLRWSDLGGDALRVVGKGGKTRPIPISPALADLLDTAAAGRPDHDNPWVFPGPTVDRHMLPGSVSKRMRSLLADGWTAHKLRHRFATRVYAGTKDILALQQLLGHSKPETTARYAAVDTDSLRAAVLVV